MNRIKHTMLNEHDEEVEVELPAEWVICGNCQGNGKHVNRAIDGHGLSREDFEEDPDFEENYFGGMYDVTCEECKGSGKVLQVSREAARRPSRSPPCRTWMRRRSMLTNAGESARWKRAC